jgi:hypothetical protein
MKPEALRLADELEALQPRNRITELEAAAELRRLHEVNQELSKALKNLVNWYGIRGGDDDDLLLPKYQPLEIEIAMDAIAKAEEKK